MRNLLSIGLLSEQDSQHNR